MFLSFCSVGLMNSVGASVVAAAVEAATEQAWRPRGPREAPDADPVAASLHSSPSGSRRGCFPSPPIGCKARDDASDVTASGQCALCGAR